MEWLLLVAFSQVYNEKEQKLEQKRVKNVQFEKEISEFTLGDKTTVHKEIIQ